MVKESHAHIGIAVDGDGDRIIICDEKGKRIDGDQIIAYLATYFKEEGLLKGNAVVATVWSNLGLEKYLHSLGISYFRSAVGERYVIEKMRETGANVGGEESGHMVLSDYAKTGDALLTAIVISCGLVKSGKKMSEIFPLFENCPCEITNVRFKSAEEVGIAMDSSIVQNTIADAQKKIEGPRPATARTSRTAPVIKVRVEGEDAALVKNLSNVIVTEIEKYS